ncbi:hypothetical protein GCM10028798_15820 [Humibacter antri]
MPNAFVTPYSGAVVLARDLREAGAYDSARAAAAPNALTRLRRGAYVPTSALSGLQQAEKHALHVLAAAATRNNPVVTGISAAILQGLPLVGYVPESIQLLAAGTSGRRRNGVVEIPRWPSASIVDGEPRVTALPDTLIEVCRTAPFLTALTMVDHALKVDRYGIRPPLTTLEALQESFERRTPFRGFARVQRVLSFAVTGAESAFETLSRFTMREIGFPKPILQYPVTLSNGQTVYGDFAWPQFRILGEADGWGKYVDPRYGKASLTERVRSEKQRDNALRRVNWTPAHWEWDDAWQRDPMEAILVDAGLRRVDRRRTLR